MVWFGMAEFFLAPITGHFNPEKVHVYAEVSGGSSATRSEESWSSGSQEP
jgi:hypothetical protein